VAIAEFLRNPSAVGSAFPASQRMVDTVLAPLKWQRLGVILEFGPGTGAFTREMLARMGPKSTLITIEPGARFVEYLRASIHDRRLRVIQGSATHAPQILEEEGLSAADCIISGLPFSTLKPAQAKTIVEGSASILTRHGVFAAYQMRTSIRPLLRQHFFSVRTDHEWWNMPPCHIYWASNPRRPCASKPAEHLLGPGRLG